MTLVDRLRIVAEDLKSEDATKSAEAVRDAIARIEAADDVIQHGYSYDACSALVREQEER